MTETQPDLPRRKAAARRKSHKKRKSSAQSSALPPPGIRWLNARQMAAKWGWSRSKLYNLVAAGDLVSSMVGGRRLFDDHSAEALVEAGARSSL